MHVCLSARRHPYTIACRCRRQQAVWIARLGTISGFAIVVGITKQELASLDHISRCGPLRLEGALNRWLAHAVSEAEVFVAVRLSPRRQCLQLTNGAFYEFGTPLCEHCIKCVLIHGKHQQENVNSFGYIVATPVPIYRCILISVAEDSRAVGGCHTFHERTRKGSERFIIKPKMHQPLVGEGHVQRRAFLLALAC